MLSSKNAKVPPKRLKINGLSAKSFGKRIKKAEKDTVRHTRKFLFSRFSRLSLVRRAVLGWVILIMILIAVSGVQWTNSRQSFVHTVSGLGGTYVEGVLGDIETLNPIFARSSAEKSVAKLLFSSLYSYDTTGSIKGELAESLVVSED